MSKRLLLSVLVVPLVAAGPVGEGHRTTAGLGYLSTEQLELAYTAREGVLLLEHTAQSPKGWTASLEASTAVGGRDYGGAVPAWQPDFAGTIALRGGFHGELGGIEIGPGWWLDPTISGLTISTSLWVGPRPLHGWLATWPGNLVGDSDIARVGVGLGHEGESLRVQLGRWASNYEEAVVLSLQGDYRIADSLWVGARLRGHNGDWDGQGEERRLVVTVSADPARLLDR